MKPLLIVLVGLSIGHLSFASLTCRKGPAPSSLESVQFESVELSSDSNLATFYSPSTNIRGLWSFLNNSWLTSSPFNVPFAVSATRFSSDSKLIALVGKNYKSVEVVNLMTGARVPMKIPAERFIWTATFSPDSTKMAVLATNMDEPYPPSESVLVFEASSGNLIFEHSFKVKQDDGWWFAFPEIIFDSSNSILVSHQIISEPMGQVFQRLNLNDHSLSQLVNIRSVSRFKLLWANAASALVTNGSEISLWDSSSSPALLKGSHKGGSVVATGVDRFALKEMDQILVYSSENFSKIAEVTYQGKIYSGSFDLSHSRQVNFLNAKGDLCSINY